MLHPGQPASTEYCRYFAHQRPPLGPGQTAVDKHLYVGVSGRDKRRAPALFGQRVIERQAGMGLRRGCARQLQYRLATVTTPIELLRDMANLAVEGKFGEQDVIPTSTIADRRQTIDSVTPINPPEAGRGGVCCHYFAGASCGSSDRRQTMLRRIAALDLASASKDQARGMRHGAIGMLEQYLHQPFNEVGRDYIVAGFRHDVVRVTKPESTLKVGDRPAITAVAFDANRGVSRGVIAQ
jgi:hypothetical protein